MSWYSEYAPFSDNRTPILIGLNATTPADGAVPVAVDPATGAILVEGGGGGTQYTDGAAAPTHPVGNTIEWNNSGTWETVSAAQPLPVTATLSLTNYALETGGNLATLAGTVSSSKVNVNITNASLIVTQSTAANLLANVGSISGAVNVGQQTSNTSAVQLSASSTIPTNGIIIQAISTNTASVFIGGSGVTTSNGFELQAGQATPFTANLNTLYVIGSNSSDKVCWTVV